MLFTLLRRWVSTNKRRYRHGRYDLDLSYILPGRIIAMGYPSSGLRATHRNPATEAVHFLQAHHEGHYKIWNLCIERGWQYHASVMGKDAQVVECPLYDGQAPPLHILHAFCQEATDWLLAHPSNVVVVHCKAGKGRTGSLIGSLLVHLLKHAPQEVPGLVEELGGADRVKALWQEAACEVHPRQVDQQQEVGQGREDGQNGQQQRDRQVVQQQRQQGGQQQQEVIQQHLRQGATQQVQVEQQLQQHQQQGSLARSLLDGPPKQRPLQGRALSTLVLAVLRRFDDARTVNGQALTISSQRRFVSYYAQTLAATSLPEPSRTASPSPGQDGISSITSTGGNNNAGGGSWSISPGRDVQLTSLIIRGLPRTLVREPGCLPISPALLGHSGSQRFKASATSNHAAGGVQGLGNGQAPEPALYPPSQPAPAAGESQSAPADGKAPHQQVSCLTATSPQQGGATQAGMPASQLSSSVTHSRGGHSGSSKGLVPGQGCTVCIWVRPPGDHEAYLLGYCWPQLAVQGVQGQQYNHKALGTKGCMVKPHRTHSTVPLSRVVGASAIPAIQARAGGNATRGAGAAQQQGQHASEGALQTSHDSSDAVVICSGWVTLDGDIHVQLQLQQEEDLVHKLQDAAGTIARSVKESIHPPEQQNTQTAVEPAQQPQGPDGVAASNGTDTSAGLDERAGAGALVPGAVTGHSWQGDGISSSSRPQPDQHYKCEQSQQYQWGEGGGTLSSTGDPWISGDIKIQVFKGRLVPRQAAVFKSPRSLFYAWVSASGLPWHSLHTAAANHPAHTYRHTTWSQHRRHITATAQGTQVASGQPGPCNGSSGNPADQSSNPGDQSSNPADRSSNPGDQCSNPGDQSSNPGDHSNTYGRPPGAAGDVSTQPAQEAPVNGSAAAEDASGGQGMQQGAVLVPLDRQSDRPLDQDCSLLPHVPTQANALSPASNHHSSKPTQPTPPRDFTVPTMTGAASGTVQAGAGAGRQGTGFPHYSSLGCSEPPPLQQVVLGPLELDKLPRKLRKKEQNRWQEASKQGSCRGGETLSAEFEQSETKGPSLHILYRLGPTHQ